ncbi:carbohydrate ABC transporter permease [Humidisolicoccus flavus]|uniref:carbohydrate ABC transporter permease n=1 Tax=Humidisolicoccus flavus TaxID=3111414 RepID=UPI00324B35A6
MQTTKGRRVQKLRRPRAAGWIMLTPALLGVAIIAIYPLVYTIAVSLTRSSLGQPFQEFVGINQLVAAFTGDATLASVVRSLTFALPSAVIAVVLGLIIALALQRGVRKGKFIRVVLLLPLMTPPVMVGVIWKLMLTPTGGLFNNVLRSFDFINEPVLFLGSSPMAMISLVLVDVWQWTPFCVLLIYAGLQGLPVEVYEAAQVDGATPFRLLRSVVLPLLAPTIATVLLLKTILSFKVFDLVFIMTSGGPGLDTTVASYQIYKTTLEKFDLGAAGAQTIVFLILVTVVILPLSGLRSKVTKAVQ